MTGSERLAESRLSATAFDYYFGGAQDEVTLRENRAAYDRITLYFRILVDVSKRSTETTVLGERVFDNRPDVRSRQSPGGEIYETSLWFYSKVKKKTRA